MTHKSSHVIIHKALVAPLTENGKWKSWHLLVLTNLANAVGWFF
jgi:hypothetical protein